MLRFYTADDLHYIFIIDEDNGVVINWGIVKHTGDVSSESFRGLIPRMIHAYSGMYEVAINLDTGEVTKC